MISMHRLLALTGDRPQSVISDIWKPRLLALRELGETDIPTLLAAWQKQGGTWIAGKVSWAQELPTLGDPMRRKTVWRVETFVENAAVVQATTSYWSAGLEAYRGAYERAAGSFLGMLMEALGEPVRDAPVTTPEHLRMRFIILIRPPYAGQWHGLHPCYLQDRWFETWASVSADPDEVQSFVLRLPGRRSVYAFRSNRDVRFEWGKNGRVQERLVIPAGIPWCTFPSIAKCRDEVIDIEALEPCQTPGRQALVDSNYRW